MKYILPISIIVLFISGCGVSEDKVLESSKFKKLERDDYYTIIQDKDTGCKYISMKHYNAGGLTPLLNKAGKPDCSK